MKFPKLVLSLFVLLCVVPFVAAYNINVLCPTPVSVGDTFTCTLALTDPNSQGPIPGPFGAQFNMSVSNPSVLGETGTGDGQLDFTPVSPISGSSGGLDAGTVLFTLSSNPISPQNVATFRLRATQNGVVTVSLRGLSIVYGASSTSDPLAASTPRTITVSSPVSCGDGSVISPETCDDSNTASGDGCSSTCQQEAGYYCRGAGPNSCSLSVCGNFVVAISAGEQCDDGNVVNGDGCSSTCAIEQGWTCNASPSVCTQPPPVCGNNLREGTEECDGTDLAGQDCVSQGGPATGTISCSTACQFDLTGCGNIVNPEVCGDSLDNDFDGSIDCADSDCFGLPSCPGTGTPCLDNENIVATSCVCQLPFERIGDVCTGLLGRIRIILNDLSLSRLQKISSVASELRSYFLG